MNIKSNIKHILQCTYTMKFEINEKKKCELFINLFNNLKYFTDNVLIRIDKTKMYIQGMDNSHVCVYELKLDNSWFNVWNVKNSLDFGINLPLFNKMLHVWSDKQTIIIHDEDGDNLNIEFTSDVTGVFNKYLVLPLMDIDCEMLGIPDTEYEADITLISCKMKQIMDELSSFNDTINLNCNEERVAIDATSCEGSMKVVIKIDDIESLAVMEGETIESSFSIKYIAYMCQFHKISENCTISLSANTPMKMKYDIDENSDMVFYLAPKMID